MIELVERAEGVILPVRAQAGARANAIRGQQHGALKVAVTQVAEKGKANQAILDLLCKTLGLKRSQVTLIAGETSAQKRFLICGLPLKELAQRVQELV